MIPITHDKTKHGLINYQDSITTMDKLYILNRVLTEGIQTHMKGRGLLSNLEDDLDSLMRSSSLAPLA